MERLELDFQKLLEAQTALEDVLEEAKKNENMTPKQISIHQDSMIKRFEFIYESLWKYLKTYLKEKYGIIATSPKKVFQECLTQKITDKNQATQLMAMVDDRNLTIHTYDETIAARISKRIPTHYNLMVEITKKITP